MRSCAWGVVVGQMTGRYEDEIEFSLVDPGAVRSLGGQPCAGGGTGWFAVPDGSDIDATPVFSPMLAGWYIYWLGLERLR